MPLIRLRKQKFLGHVCVLFEQNRKKLNRSGVGALEPVVNATSRI